MNLEVKQKFASFSPDAQSALMSLRAIIYDVAKAESLTLEECLKWGQLSYLTKTGSTLRMDWSANKPMQYRVFFNCKTNLVETFKEIYGDLFAYETNRVIVFDIGSEIPTAEFAACVHMTLKYHQLKSLPLLGG